VARFSFYHPIRRRTSLADGGGGSRGIAPPEEADPRSEVDVVFGLPVDPPSEMEMVSLALSE
jgi:hypothetical protein